MLVPHHGNCGTWPNSVVGLFRVDWRDGGGGLRFDLSVLFVIHIALAIRLQPRTNSIVTSSLLSYLFATCPSPSQMSSHLVDPDGL